MTRPIFSLAQARALLPQVKLLTADAVIRAEALTAELQQLSEADPAHAQLTEALREIVDGWAAAVRALGLEAKGCGWSISATARGITAGDTRNWSSATITATTTGLRGESRFNNRGRDKSTQSSGSTWLQGRHAYI